MMLIVSFLFIVIACMFLYLEENKFSLQGESAAGR